MENHYTTVWPAAPMLEMGRREPLQPLAPMLEMGRREPLQAMNHNYQDQPLSIIRKYERERKCIQRERQRIAGERGHEAVDDEEKKKISSQIVKAFKSRTKGLCNEAKWEIWSLVAEHPFVRAISDQSHEEEAAVQSTIFSNVRNTLAIVKQPSSNEELFLKNATLQMMLHSKENMPIAKFSRVLKIDHRSLFKAKSRQGKPGVNARLFSLAACHKQHRQSPITDEIKELVYTFWRDETRVSPNKKDVCRKRVGRKSYIKHPVHLLDESQVINDILAP